MGHWIADERIGRGGRGGGEIDILLTMTTLHIIPVTVRDLIIAQRQSLV